MTAAARSLATRGATAGRMPVALLVLGAACAMMFVTNLTLGAVDATPGQVLAILAAQLGIELPWSYSPQQEAVILSIRMPRAVLGILIGGSLGVCGAALQGLFRNPLADPGLIGVSAGAALAAVSMIVLGSTLLPGFVAWSRGFALPISAFAGGLAATVIVYLVARQGGRTVVATLLLAGVAISAIASAGLGLLVFVADDDQLRTLNFWLLGSLAAGGWATILPALPLILAPMIYLPWRARTLNALLLGEAEAAHLGVEVERFKRVLIVLVALGTGAAVALSGIIGFVGLVVPHIMRLAAGPDHRLVIPGTVLLGATLLPGADIVARLAVAPAELPIGILTSLIGGPFFLWLLIRQRDRIG